MRRTIADLRDLDTELLLLNNPTVSNSMALPLLSNPNMALPKANTLHNNKVNTVLPQDLHLDSMVPLHNNPHMVSSRSMALLLLSNLRMANSPNTANNPLMALQLQQQADMAHHPLNNTHNNRLTELLSSNIPNLPRHP